tara:strand:+ start:83 stop:379 length:297 start_codon:yes stop_codon:yes gene_type:complete
MLRKEKALHCIDCEEKTTRVYNSGVSKQGISFRFRVCAVCGARFKTEETVKKRMTNLKDDPEAEKKLKTKMNGKISLAKIKYNTMLEPIPILDKDVDM